ncbi:MAG: hypothetical protein ACREFS_17040, partial [Acetobacteraceae bacterium]
TIHSVSCRLTVSPTSPEDARDGGPETGHKGEQADQYAEGQRRRSADRRRTHAGACNLLQSDRRRSPAISLWNGPPRIHDERAHPALDHAIAKPFR